MDAPIPYIRRVIYAMMGVLFLIIVAMNIANIIVCGNALSYDEHCDTFIHLNRFFIGSIIASAMTIPLFFGGLSVVISFIFGIVGTTWYYQARQYCLDTAPNWIAATNWSVFFLWFTTVIGAFYVAFMYIFAYGMIRGVQQGAAETTSTWRRWL